MAREDKEDRTDHDLLITIDANLENFLKSFSAHVVEDKENFTNIDKRLKTLEKVLWSATGVVVFLEIIFKFT